MSIDFFSFFVNRILFIDRQHPSPQTAEQNEKEEQNLIQLPEEIVILIFKQLNLQGYRDLSLVNHSLYQYSKNAQVIASLWERTLMPLNKIPTDKIVSYTQLAGPFLTRLDLKKMANVTDELKKIISQACPNALLIFPLEEDNIEKQILKDLHKILINHDNQPLLMTQLFDAIRELDPNLNLKRIKIINKYGGMIKFIDYYHHLFIRGALPLCRICLKNPISKMDE